MIFTLGELVDAILMTLIVGYLFKDAFKMPKKHTDILDIYTSKAKTIWHRDWHDLAWAAALIAPSIIIHELGHKLSALAFGLTAQFHGACTVQGGNILGQVLAFPCNIQLLAVILKTVGFSFFIFIPAYVSIQGQAGPLVHALISFMGPFIHLVFWLGTAYVLKDVKRIRKWPQRKQVFFHFFKKINMFLFIFNMIPIPGFDGYWVFTNLWKAFF